MKHCGGHHRDLEKNYKENTITVESVMAADGIAAAQPCKARFAVFNHI